MIPTVDGELDMDAAHKMLSDKVKLLAVTAVSNVTGTVVDIETLIAWAKESLIWQNCNAIFLVFPPIK